MPRTFYPALDAFRGIAAISVVFYHLKFVNETSWAFFDGAGILVDFFFLLSGFVMSHAYLPRIREGLAFATFLRGRFARLYPLHLFLLLVWVPYILVKIYVYHTIEIGKDPSVTENLWSFLMHVLLLHAMHTVDGLSWNYPAWSISVEFWAYISFFILLRVAKKYSTYAMGLIVLCSAVLLALLGSSDAAKEGILFTYDYGFIRCLMSFFLGCLIYKLHRRFTLQASEGLQNSVEVLLVLGCVVVVLKSVDGVAWQFAAVVTFAVTLFWFAGSGGLVTRVLCARIFGFLGLISYSVYMTHAIVVAAADNIARYVFKMSIVEITSGTHRPEINTPWADAINIAIVLVVIGVSTLTYRYIEVPGKRLGHIKRVEIKT